MWKNVFCHLLLILQTYSGNANSRGSNSIELPFSLTLWGWNFWASLGSCSPSPLPGPPVWTWCSGSPPGGTKQPPPSHPENHPQRQELCLPHLSIPPIQLQERCSTDVRWRKDHPQVVHHRFKRKRALEEGCLLLGIFSGDFSVTAGGPPDHFMWVLWADSSNLSSPEWGLPRTPVDGSPHLVVITHSLRGARHFLHPFHLWFTPRPLWWGEDTLNRFPPPPRDTLGASPLLFTHATLLITSRGPSPL